MTHRVHFAGVPCATLARTYSWRRVVAEHPEDVTCFICLYHMGLYMPLTKLREHQRFNHVLAGCGLKRRGSEADFSDPYLA